MALGITHPDYLDSHDRIDAYRRYLDFARQKSGMWHGLPRDVAAWWRQRDASTLHRDLIDGWKICGPAAARARVADLCSIISRAPEPRSTIGIAPSRFAEDFHLCAD
jgi:hypothetical protein